jgi:two-component system phosphate regulon sensor histidine kinase PhoR
MEGVIVTLQDTTEQRRLHRLRQEFVANASHELRTPVAAILSLAEALDAGALRDEHLGPEFVSSIVQNANSLTELLADMLTLARFEEPHDPSADRARVDTSAVLREAASRLEPLAHAKGVRIAVESPDGLMVWCAEYRLMAALVNLVDNAVKYSPDNGLVRLRAEDAEDGVRLTVTDEGPGIPASVRQRVFERFYRVGKGRSRGLGGTGLGLAIVRHAVEADLGRVWVEAPDGGGARLVVLLPRSEP